MTLYEIMEAMGTDTTEREAVAMQEVLGEREITDLTEINDEEFFALVAEALNRAREK